MPARKAKPKAPEQPVKRGRGRPKLIKPRNVGGRPTKYRPEYVDQVRHLVERGYTMTQVAEFLGVNRDSLFTWQHEHPELLAAAREGRDMQDDNVEASLYKRAIGFETKETREVVRGGKVVERIITKKQFAPDTGAAFIWLQNKRPGQWKNRREVTAAVSVSHEQALDMLDSIPVSGALDALDAIDEPENGGE